MSSASGQRLRLVVPRYGPDVIGGSESLIRQLAHSLRDADWSVQVFTTCADDERAWRNASPPGRRLEEGIDVHRFPVVVPRLPNTFHQFSRVHFRLPQRLRPEAAWIAAQGPLTPRLVNALRRSESLPTLFMPYLFYPTLRGLPVTPGVRLLIPAAHDERPLYLRHVSRLVSATDALLYSTIEEQALFETAHPHARALPHAVGTVAITPPQGIDAQRFRDRHAVRGDYFIYGGRTAVGKGMDELLEGIAWIRRNGRPDVELVLTGEAGQGFALSAGVRRLGRLDALDRWDAIAGATAAIVPSFHESLSLLALEAWAVGRPVLLNAASPVLAGQAARSGGALTYVGPEGLADAAAALLADPERGTALGAAGREHVAASYRWPAVHERLTELIAQGARRGDQAGRA